MKRLQHRKKSNLRKKKNKKIDGAGLATRRAAAISANPGIGTEVPGITS